jgi:enamine deaminase RidA (YjgF/YER057c/UK114 family)
MPTTVLALIAGRTSILLVLLSLSSSIAQAQQERSRFINPPGLTKPIGYTHVVVTSDGRTAYIAGQVALDSAGQVVGGGDFKAQAQQVFVNLRRALGSVGASFEDVLKTTTYITNLENLPALREARGRYFNSARPPANTLVPVATLARPELLLEIEAVVELQPPVVRHTR